MKTHFLLTICILALLFLAPLAGKAQTSGNAFPLDIVWEADTYTPADFAGKALPGRASQLRIVALTPTQNTNNIEFSWSVLDRSSLSPAADLQGRGENVFMFKTESTLSNFAHEIALTAQNVLTGAESRRTITIPLQKPEVHIQTNTALPNDIPLSAGSQKELRALPLYFSVQSLDELAFSWSVGRQEAQNTGRDDVLMLRIPSQTPAGVQREVRVSAEKAGYFSERANDSLRFITTQ